MSDIFTLDYLKRISSLSRLHIDEGDLPKYKNQLNAILDQMQIINNIDTDNIEPMYSVSESLDYSFEDLSREDTVVDNISSSDVLKHSKYSARGYIVVPKAID